MLKGPKRVENVIFNVIQALNDTYKRCDIRYKAIISGIGVSITLFFTINKKERSLYTVFNLEEYKTYKELFYDLYNRFSSHLKRLLQYDIIQRL